MKELTLERIVCIKNTQYLEKVLKDNNTNFYTLYDLLSREDIIIDESFDVKKEYDGLHPHVLLNPTKSGLDLQAISFEVGDNSTDAHCETLEYRFEVNENKLVDIICSDDGDGIENHDIKKAVAYGGYFGPPDKTKSGKFMEGLSNACGSIAGITYIYTNTGDGNGWYKSIVNFNKLKEMIKVFESNIVKLPDLKKEIYRGLSYKYMVSSYIDDPKKTSIDEIKHILNSNILVKDHGTIIIFKDCYKDIIDESFLDTDIQELKYLLGRRYWKDIDKGTKITVVNKSNSEEIKSIDIMMRSNNCNYRNALDTKYFELPDMFKVSDFTGKEEDSDYLPVNLSIKKKTDLYYYNQNRKNPGAPDGKIRVPSILAITLDNQGICVERNNRPISDTLPFGQKNHPNYTGISIELCVDSRLDDILFVTGDKSRLSARRLKRVLGEKLENIVTQLKAIKSNKKQSISYINTKGEIIEVFPTLIKYQPSVSDDKIINGEQKNIDNSNSDDENNYKESISSIVIKNNEKNLYIDGSNSDYGSLKITSNNNDIEKEPIDIGNGLRSVNGEGVTGLVFAAKHKSQGRLESFNSIMKYDIKDDLYLVFDEEIDKFEGIKNKHLQNWWSKKTNVSKTLEERMRESIAGNIYQELVFNTYKNKVEHLLKEEAPALLPEVEVYRNTYTNKENPYSAPQRMDFCLVLKNNKQILIELDGIQHISNKDNDKWIACDEKYARQCEFDNEWQLKGNEIYRISNKTFKNMKTDDEKSIFIEDFFRKLFEKHNIIKKSN